VPTTYTAPASESDTLLFLTVDTPESNRMILELWDDHSGAPGLLSASAGYTYNPVNRKFTKTRTGRQVTDQELAQYVKNISNESRRRMKKNTQQLIAGIILLGTWYAQMRDLMRALYKTIWILSIGGFVFDDDFSRNLFYAFVLLNFSYLDNFAEQLRDGRQPLNGFAMTRAGLYGSAGNGIWQNILLDQAMADGRTEGRRLLGPNENHCTDGDRPGCIEQAGLGWVPIEQVVKIGDAQCYCITTPESRVVTIDGLVTLNDVRVGDFVLTHKMNWRKVTKKIVKVSQPYHRQIFIKAPNGEWVGATDNHLWFTDQGFRDANSIYNSRNKVYNIPLEDNYEQNMQVWKKKRPPCEAVPQLRKQGYGERSMEDWGDKGENVRSHSESSGNQKDAIRGYNHRIQLAQKNGWEVFYPLLERRRKEVLYISIPMGMDKEQRSNNSRVSHTPYQPRQERRQTGKFTVDESIFSPKTSLKNKSPNAENEMELNVSALWRDVSRRKPRWQEAEILFDEMPVGTLLYDIEVEEDHSFCLEGLFAHNSNCLCVLQFR
jgi:hypothetical protein